MHSSILSVSKQLVGSKSRFAVEEPGRAYSHYSQGQTASTRWQWNATVGPLLDRPGRVGDWGYVNTE